MPPRFVGRGGRALDPSKSTDAGAEILYPNLDKFFFQLHVSADMFESVNKKTLIHPLCMVGFSIVKGLPEEARLYNDG